MVKHSSGSRTRTAYLLRRTAGGSIILAIIFFFVLSDYSIGDRLLFSGIFVAIAILCGILAPIADRRGIDRTKEFDEKGNVKKKVL